MLISLCHRQVERQRGGPDSSAFQKLNAAEALPDTVSSFRASQRRWMMNYFSGSFATFYISRTCVVLYEDVILEAVTVVQGPAPGVCLFFPLLAGVPPPPKLGYHSFQSLIVHMHMQSLKNLGFSMLFEATVAVATILIVSDASKIKLHLNGSMSGNLSP